MKANNVFFPANRKMFQKRYWNVVFWLWKNLWSKVVFFFFFFFFRKLFYNISATYKNVMESHCNLLEFSWNLTATFVLSWNLTATLTNFWASLQPSRTFLSPYCNLLIIFIDPHCSLQGRSCNLTVTFFKLYKNLTATFKT